MGAAKDAGYRLDVLLAAESRSGRAGARPDAIASSRKVSKTAVAKASSKAKAKSTAPRDGAGEATLQKKNPAAKTKKTTKTSNPSKRKP
jgi:hypothetical protein